MLNLSFSPFPEFQTERLLLRKLRITDDEDVLAIRSNKKVNEFIERPKTVSIEDARAFINKISDNLKNYESILWVIEMKHDKKMAGSVCLWNIAKEKERAEIGYELFPEYNGMGIMREAFSMVIPYGFEIMKLRKIEAFTSGLNTRSLKLLEKSGFKRDTATESKIDMSKEPAHAVIYSLFNQVR